MGRALAVTTNGVGDIRDIDTSAMYHPRVSADAVYSLKSLMHCSVDINGHRDFVYTVNMADFRRGARHQNWEGPKVFFFKCL